jgi:hypothetical protein
MCNDEAQPELPPLKEMAKGFLGSVKDVLLGAVQGEDIVVTEEVYTSRMNICNSCEFFRKTDSRCAKCGCFMEAKTRFKRTFCPIHKWGAE